MKDYVAQFSKNVARISNNVARVSEPIAGKRSRLGEPNDNDSNYCCERGAVMVRQSNCTSIMEKSITRKLAGSKHIDFAGDNAGVRLIAKTLQSSYNGASQAAVHSL